MPRIGRFQHSWDWVHVGAEVNVLVGAAKDFVDFRGFVGRFEVGFVICLTAGGKVAAVHDEGDNMSQTHIGVKG